MEKRGAGGIELAGAGGYVAGVGADLSTLSLMQEEIRRDGDSILLDRVKFVSPKDDAHPTLHVLDQSILLSLCLDVKSFNPTFS